MKIIKQKKILASFCGVIILLSSFFLVKYFIQNNHVVERNSRAWYYPNLDDGEFPDQEIEKIVQICHKWNIDGLIISINGKSLNNNLTSYNELIWNHLARIVSELQRNQIDCILMTLEDPIFTFLNRTESGKQHLQGVLNFAKEYSIEEIHLDIEPHALEEWKTGSNETQMQIIQEFNKTLAIYNEYVSSFSTTIVLSLAITWWMEKKYSIQDWAIDCVYKMFYDGIGGSADEVLSRVTNQNASKSYYVGLNPEEFESEDLAFNSSITIDNEMNNFDLYQGLCWYSLNRLLDFG